MASTEEQDRKIVLEFCHLLEKSKQLFNGLRDLPQYGHRQWQAYFGRTFDVYTKLWKFQQQHRLKMKLVRELVIELERQIQEYTTTYVASRRYEPEDQLEWSLVLEEIKGFIKAESAVAVLHADTNPIVLSHSTFTRVDLKWFRFQVKPADDATVRANAHMTLSLQEILIVGSACEQAKFSELTMDMFR
ncbi:hypothetical protein AND_010294 [Anopheles darlingi]|uniref:Uncharacterized protein n=1 Tax=Anopheles darlingi TaxID=43151 RepID=W5J438_ANODA|nr:hypothetical protein AND_010294 [Anopheles darlingi]